MDSLPLEIVDMIVDLVQHPALVEPPPLYAVGTIPLRHPDAIKKLQLLRQINRNWCQSATRLLFNQVTIRPSNRQPLHHDFLTKYGHYVRELVVIWDSRPTQDHVLKYNLDVTGAGFPRLAVLHVSVPVHFYAHKDMTLRDLLTTHNMIFKSIPRFPQVNHLKFTCLLPSNLSPPLLANVDKCIENLTTLEIAISTAFVGKRSYIDDQGEEDENLKSLVKLLHRFKSLKSLRILGNSWAMNHDVDEEELPVGEESVSMSPDTLKNLDSLTDLFFDGVSLHGDLLVALLKRNKTSLRSLTLKHWELVGGFSWNDIFDQLCQFPNLLEFYSLNCFYEDQQFHMSHIFGMPSGLEAAQFAPVRSSQVNDYHSLNALELSINSTRRNHGLAELPPQAKHFLKYYNTSQASDS